VISPYKFITTILYHKAIAFSTIICICNNIKIIFKHYFLNTLKNWDYLRKSLDFKGQIHQNKQLKGHKLYKG